MSTAPTRSISNGAASTLLFLIALGIRLPNMLQVPVYTDEGQDVLWALDIAQGRHLPLSGIDGYTGPFFPYALAALFRICGTSIALPRTVSVVCGALLVPTAYWLGCVMWNRLAGVIAATLTMTSPTLVVMSSHYGWPSAWVPLFTTATVASIYTGVTRDRRWLLALGGALAALSVQLHPTTLVLSIGLALWMVSSRRNRVWLTRPALYGALVLFVVVNAPLIVANTRGAHPMLTDASQRTYAFGLAGGWQEYLLRIGSLLRSSLAAMGGLLPPITPADRAREALIAIATVAGVAFAWRVNNRLIPLLFFTVVTVLPIVVFGFSNRYFIFLLPMAYVAIAGVASELIACRRSDTIWPSASVRWRLTANVCAGAIAMLVVGGSLLTIYRHYRFAWATGRTNDAYYQLLTVLHEQHACGSRLLLEQVPSPEEPFAPSNFAMNTVHYLLTLDGCVHASVPTTTADSFTGDAGAQWWVAARAIASQGAESSRLVATRQLPVFSDLVSVSVYERHPEKR